ncbi:MAG: HYExAFE family protein [Planctomycetota bacterium]
MKAHIDYEAAFENYLQRRQVPYVAVDEAKRAAFRDAKLKSFDFIVYSTGGTNWLVDIKGRRWAARKAGGRPAWENWVTQADLDGLRQWQEVFGVGFAALLVFAYRLDADGQPPTEVVHEYRGARYVFAAVPLDDYATLARRRSPKWGTVNVPVREFAQRVRPISDWL